MRDELEMVGLTLPSPTYIVGTILFGIAGIFAYYDGKRHGRLRERWVGLALMLYPYAIGTTWLLFVVGFALCACAWFDRRNG